MAKPTFTNEQLAVAWRKHAFSEPKGTRNDVVTDLMVVLDVENTKSNRKRVYNNVTQRIRQLGEHKNSPVTFPALAVGKKGAPRTNESMKQLQNLLLSPESEADADAPGE